MLTADVILWGLLLAVFLVLEAGTVALVSIWFALGAAAALIAAWLGAALWIQTAAFLAGSGILLALLRPVMRRHMKTTKTNLDSILGAQCLVTADIDNVTFTGEVRLGGMTWTARSSGGAPIPTGTRVRIDRIEGVKVFVTPLPPSEQNP